MLEPLFELMLDAIDMGMTIVVLLALWDGRQAGFRTRMITWLAGSKAAPQGVEQFLAAARRAHAVALSRRSATPAPPTTANLLPGTDQRVSPRPDVGGPGAPYRPAPRG